MDAPANLRSFFSHFLACICFAALGCLPASASNPAPTNQSIPWAQLGANATAQYSGDGLGVIATPRGAQLRCVLQKLEGEVTAEGLSLNSTVPGSRDQLHVAATRLGRDAGQSLVLDKQGVVQVVDAHARYVRPALIEEYSVTADGIRQDFLVTQSPAGPGPLRLHLTLRGARAESSPDGAQLVLNESGRKLNYNRLRVTDATGRELAAWMELHGKSEIQNPKSKMELAVVVEDAGTLYPLRIDPTFSDANWISMGGVPGANGPIYASVVDGSGNLYIAGNFTLAGDVLVTNIAKWDGTNWSALGSGIGGRGPAASARVNALAAAGNDLYAGGYFTNAGGNAANYIAKWNGSSWSALGQGMNANVSVLTLSGNNLYAGGYFTNAGGIAANRIAKWDGVAWSPLGSGVSGGYPSVDALAVSGSEVYAAGGFTMAGGIPVNHIAKWNGSSWSALGVGLGDYVWALALAADGLYAGGRFTTASGTNANYIAKWDGTSWSALDSGMDDEVYAIMLSGSDLYAAGYFSTAGGVNADGIARWNGSFWSALGSGFRSAEALAISGTNLYAGGQFSTAGGISANNIAKWDGSSWSALATGLKSGLNSEVFALAVSENDVYAAGFFTKAGEINARRIAKWNGSSWSTLGEGMNFTVFVLAASRSELYAGGDFTTADGVSANRIAKWNGNSWSALGQGMNNRVYALAVSGSDLYAGGAFSRAGGSNANNIAKWNGNVWSALGSGMNETVVALAVRGSTLYAGGYFTTAGGIAAQRIAKWDGNNWSALGLGIGSTGVTSSVWALAVSGTDLYAGGQFSTAGGISATNIAKWDGSSWSALGGLGIKWADSVVHGLIIFGGDLYVGGAFRWPSGVTGPNHIAKWDGISWSALGSGVSGMDLPNSWVRALAMSGNHLYVGGNFTIAGDKVSAYIAKARIASAAESIAASGSSATIQFSGVVGYEYHVQRTSGLTPPMTWTTLTTDPLSPADDGSLTFTDTTAPPGAAYYRLAEN